MVRKSLLTLLLLVVFVVAAVLVYAATKPDSFRVSRTTIIRAPAEKIFARVNDLKSQRDWSTWEMKDPAMKRRYSGPDAGKGAAYEWEGNSDIGKGRMEITESTPSTKVVFDMHFIEPFEGRSTAEIKLVPAGEATAVTWAIHGANNYICKVLTVFIDQDAMIGNEFAVSLARLKTLTEM
jgi:Polyketide cyclase / dehydrase and lipid transport